MSGYGLALMNFHATEIGRNQFLIKFNVQIFGQECKLCKTHGIKFGDDESIDICAHKLSKYAL